MNNTLSKTLGLGLPALAEMIRAKGRGKDTILAHITPKEAALLKRRGGSGTINPDTGLLEFEDSEEYDYSAPADVSPVYDVIGPEGDFQTYYPSPYIPNDIPSMDNRDIGQVETTYDGQIPFDILSSPQTSTGGQDYSKFEKDPDGDIEHKAAWDNWQKQFDGSGLRGWWD
jgi:hypothetical protein